VTMALMRQGTYGAAHRRRFGCRRNGPGWLGHAVCPLLEGPSNTRIERRVRPKEVIELAAIVAAAPGITRSAMARPHLPPHLVPRQPKTVLGWTMQKLRMVHGWSGKQTAEAFGCSPSHISRVEHGSNAPSRALVQFYEETFEADGLLLSLFEVAEHNAEQERRRAGGHRPDATRAIPGDASTFIDDTIPHGTLMTPGQFFTKVWRVRNSGSVPWHARQLERQGPLTGPGLVTSLRYLPIPDTQPGAIAEITVGLKAPTYDCSSIAYFKMADGQGALCFPDSYQLGLDVLVRVVGQRLDT
jgi:transcriptional regulator with XRE-family HTH domain